MDHPRLDQVRRLRLKVKELHAMAAQMKDPGARTVCLRTAQSYEELIDLEERRILFDLPELEA
jgi:hypothetical protein